MPANYVLLETVTMNSFQGATIVFNSIPQSGYTDLVVKGCTRDTGVNGAIVWQFNADTTNGNYVTKRLQTNGASAYADTTTRYIAQNGTNETANTFTSWEMYIPNYNAATNHTFMIDQVVETNGSTLNNESSALAACYWTGGAAITSITLSTNAGWATNSTISIYGVAAFGTTPVTAPKATGGDIIQTDGTYWYHAFLSSGIFTPTQTLNCSVLQVAGGGGGGSRSGGGGGAGGISYLATQSVIASAQAITIGAGGTGGSRSVNGSAGSNSQFASLTAAVGGGVGASALGNIYSTSGGPGGSGGGGANNGTGGAGTSGQGFAGGNSNSSSFDAAGGGGAGAVGANASTGGAGSGAGAGGAGVNTYSTWLNTTGTGVSGFIAGGGGGGSYGSSNHGAGGAGGGGNGADTAPTNGTANTGGGAGGAGNSANTNGTPVGANGGSGIVIVRYAV